MPGRNVAHYVDGVRRCYERARAALTRDQFEAFVAEANLIGYNAASALGDRPADTVVIMTSGGRVEAVRAADAPRF